MKEHPILFSAPMVRALLDGSKTQTRRIAPIQSLNIRLLDFFGRPGVSWAVAFTKPMGPSRSIASYSGAPVSEAQARSIITSQFFPYGQPGDRLWVRETFSKIIGQTGGWIETDYKATYTHGDRLGDSMCVKKKWTPSIFMPRDASRITLEITGVRVERLQEISEADAIDEGIRAEKNRLYHCGFDDDGEIKCKSPVTAYAWLWNSINAKRAPWVSNPWVWVIEFKRLLK